MYSGSRAAACSRTAAARPSVHDRRPRRPGPRSRPAAGRPGCPRGRSPPPGPPRACAASTASTSPGSIRNPRILTWSSARPSELQLPVAPSTGPGPRSGTSAPRRPRTGRPRTAPRSAPPGPGSRGPAAPRPRTAPRPPRPAPGAATRPARTPGCWPPARPIGGTGPVPDTASVLTATVASVGPYALTSRGPRHHRADRAPATAAPRRR